MTVAVAAKVVTTILVICAASYSDQAADILDALNDQVTENFGAWYMYVMFAFVLISVLVALWPSSAHIRLGRDDERPEFSRFSWIAMMFGAGIGTGVLTYSSAEPMVHFASNPDIINGLTEAKTAEGSRAAMKWSILHWGLSAWGCYAIIGLAFAFYSFNRGLPLTVRSALVSLLGRHMSGPLGHIVDLAAVLATIVGVAITIGYGVAQFASGVFNISASNWIMTTDGAPTLLAMLAALILIMLISTFSALSGVERGIKWLSDINLTLSIFLLLFFLTVGPTLLELEFLAVGIWDYAREFPVMATQVFHDDGSAQGQLLAEWQGAWTIFYWAWWIAFAPFVGMFLARVSRGRTIREYILGAMIVPSLVCFTWFTFIGGTAMSLELSGEAGGRILAAGLSSQLFATINVMLANEWSTVMSAIIVLLLITFLVTSAQSAILVIHTILSGGDDSRRPARHIMTWGLLITVVIGVLLTVGGLPAINTAMIVGALPFSFVMALMVISLIKGLIEHALQHRKSDEL